MVESWILFLFHVSPEQLHLALSTLLSSPLKKKKKKKKKKMYAKCMVSINKK